MRYNASDKTEIIRLVEQGNRLGRLDGRWKGSAFPDRRFTAGMTGIGAADRKLSPIALHDRIGFGTASRRRSEVRLSTWGSINPWRLQGSIR
jgi:hypothetical protein